ncbi:MAG: hypothetical protein JWQ74_427 [Marmoricola sp.]|nr:hypothetical protein [Marmoricola sp.]
MIYRTRTRAAVAALAIAAALGTTAACGSGAEKNAGTPQGTELVGLLRLTPGAAKAGSVTGSWFRMVQVGGTADKGPYMKNADSPADGGEATLLAPGKSGGLRIGGYQTAPRPAFDEAGNSLSDAITKPVKFFGVKFSMATNAVDPQTKTDVAPPTVYLKDGRLTADLSAWGVTWNNQVFNQGAPKPVSSTGAEAIGQEKAAKAWDWVAGKYLEAAPAATTTGTGATGTYDVRTHAFTLDWTSVIEGGPFNRFIGRWHLEGTFEKDGRAPGASD